MAALPNPLVAGFNPDPSVVKVGDDYYLATSTFEYLPGLPIYHSTDMVTWTQIGNVATRPEQFELDEVPTNLGAWAPTIRHHDGRFHLVITVAGTRWMLHFTAEDPAGPWSDGTVLTEHDSDSPVNGIDPDIAWDSAGTCYVTFSGLVLSGDQMGEHRGIQQVKVDLETGKALEPARSLWSGTGGIFPEAPHLYSRGGRWYLVIAEGGTERGHAISIARSDSAEGPFETAPGNPLVTARGTARPVQCTGHGDIVQGPDGDWYVVMLGTRPRGTTRQFSALGRETFVTPARWTDDGWFEIDPVELNPREPQGWTEDFDGDTLGVRWLGVRRLPEQVSSLSARPGWLTLTGEGEGMSALRPVFVGVRQTHQTATYTARIDATSGVGGLAVRYDEDFHYEIEAGDGEVVARAVVPGISQEWRRPLTTDVVDLVMEFRPQPAGFSGGSGSCDQVVLGVLGPDGATEALATVDGRYLANESATSFTGRVVGVYATRGTIAVDSLTFDGNDT